MRIFILGAGATGSLLAQLLDRQDHHVWCGDRDPERARRFLGKKSPIAIAQVNARNLRGIVRAAKGCQLLINASASVFNEIVMRAALRLRSHYLDLSSHLTRNPFHAEQFRYAKKFEGKNRAAVINAGAAPGLTNLLVKRAADLCDEVLSAQIRLYESSESDDPISQWSPEVSFDEAVSHPRIYRDGKFKLAKRFSEIEKFRFIDPVGGARVVLAAQDEVATLPRFIPMRDLDAKIGGNEIDRLRRWHKQGKLSKSRGLAERPFCGGGFGTRRSTWAKGRCARADAQRRALPFPLHHSRPRSFHYTSGIRYRARCRSICEVFSAQGVRRLRAGNSARRNPPRHPGRRALAGPESPAQGDDSQIKFGRRRRIALKPPEGLRAAPQTPD
jgi:hypothetical protein